MTATSGIVLAAGTSSRLGRPKQLLDLAGKPVLQHVMDAAQASVLDEIVVVLGYAAHEIAAAVNILGRARIAINHEYARGQSTSLRTGLLAVDAGSSAAVFLLGDQPGVRVDAITAVVEGWRGGAGPVVQASYSGRPSHPTLFDRSTWLEMERAEGDEGARGVLARHAEWRVLVEMGGRPPDDLDTEEDYSRLRAEFEGHV